MINKADNLPHVPNEELINPYAPSKLIRGGPDIGHTFFFIDIVTKRGAKTSNIV